MEISESKKSLRKIMFEKRNSIDSDLKKKYDAAICSELEKLIISRNCKVVHSYIPLASEINIIPLLQKLLSLNIKTICPKTLPNRKLENRVLHSLIELEEGIMKTQHPAKQDVYEGNIDLIIVPGLAYDNRNFRLGYGGGYYDGFLANQPLAYKVGVFYPFQKIEIVPTEPHDFSLDAIITG